MLGTVAVPTTLPVGEPSRTSIVPAPAADRATEAFSLMARVVLELAYFTHPGTCLRRRTCRSPWWSGPDRCPCSRRSSPRGWLATGLAAGSSLPLTSHRRPSAGCRPTRRPDQQVVRRGLDHPPVARDVPVRQVGARTRSVTVFVWPGVSVTLLERPQLLAAVACPARCAGGCRAARPRRRPARRCWSRRR